MNEKIKFHLDESVNPDVAMGVRKYGIDITTSKGQSLLGKSDLKQFDFCVEQSRTLVTQDSDFLIIASQTSEHFGIVYYQPGTRSIGEIIKSIILIYEVLQPCDMYGSVEYI